MPASSSRRILEMLAVLHSRGYERLRLSPSLAPSGLYWRCHIYAVGAPGAFGESPLHSSGNEPHPFAWEDAATDTPDELAATFIERFPLTTRAGLGADPAYVRWYADMLALTAPDGLPYAYADYDLPDDHLPVAFEGGVRRDVRVPFPPEASDRADGGTRTPS